MSVTQSEPTVEWETVTFCQKIKQTEISHKENYRDKPLICNYHTKM